MRIVTCATERSNTRALFVDLGWNTLSQRRSIHRLRLMYKVFNGLSPDYLTTLLPRTTGERQPYMLRNQYNITHIRSQRQHMHHSFFPATIREWNDIPIDIRQSPTLEIFNKKLQLYIAPITKRPWYGQGDRILDIHHTRMRIGCSKLNAHLHYNLHVQDNPYCTCDNVIEDPTHFFFHCANFDAQRFVLLEEIKIFTEPNIQLLLFGSDNVSIEVNISIVVSVQKYIKNTKRFVVY